MMVLSESSDRRKGICTRWSIKSISENCIMWKAGPLERSADSFQYLVQPSEKC
jgi:hypothetical protein